MEKNDVRVGVLTHYHNSQNYGGVLQAYALCKYLNQNLACSEQINYDYLGDINSNVYRSLNLFRREIIQLKKCVRSLLKNDEDKKLMIRKDKFKAFREEIPHTRKSYSSKTIKKLGERYDCCIVGSDQVWNPEWFCEPFFLTFTSKKVKRISYAASLGKQALTENQKTLYTSLLSDFDYISVREKSAAKILGELTDKTIDTLLDPTLLLEKNDWDSITPERIISDNYVFCYFLSKDIYLRELAKSFAESKGLTLVFLMHADGYCKNDLDVPCKKIYDAGPLEFLSLIKNAEYILTDSFHASVFSCIFERQFFVFGRTDKPGMSERLLELASLFKIDKHIITAEFSNKESYMNECDDIAYEKQNDMLAQRRRDSKLFLNKAIKV